MSDIIDIKQNKRQEQIREALTNVMLNMASLEQELDSIEHKLLARVTTIKDDLNLYREQVTSIIMQLYTEYPDLQPDEPEDEGEI